MSKTSAPQLVIMTYANLSWVKEAYHLYNVLRHG